VAIDDATRLASVEVLADEQQAPPSAFSAVLWLGSTARVWSACR